MSVVQRIEDLRNELHKLVIDKGFQDPQVIGLSQKLDRLINAYYKLESMKVKATG
ncbi:MAG TPA: aspartyl-phosphate phosphatase Spo0E family protein [Syntrophomonadaceae bacterium]|nr:aspartyl-phosphate phosphatase Spo0E family protein [Syntrophomonadaceae bacterium]